MILAVGAALVLVGAGYLMTGPHGGDGTGADDPQTNGSPVSEAVTAWVPTASDTLQLQLSGRIDTTYEADIYALDLYDTPSNVIEELQSEGRRVTCYLSAGAWEEWRPDAQSFPAKVLGDDLQGSTTERWLDIRDLGTLRPLLADRVADCAAKGFDGVYFDNVDGYANESGFPLDADDQRSFNAMLAQLAHDESLAAGLTNAPALAPDLEPDFDFAISTGCYQFDECSFYQAFADAGKPVFVVEFEVEKRDLCPRADADGFVAQRKRYNLGAWRDACWD